MSAVRPIAGGAQPLPHGADGNGVRRRLASRSRGTLAGDSAASAPDVGDVLGPSLSRTHTRDSAARVWQAAGRTSRLEISGMASAHREAGSRPAAALALTEDASHRACANGRRILRRKIVPGRGRSRPAPTDASPLSFLSHAARGATRKPRETPPATLSRASSVPRSIGGRMARTMQPFSP